MKVLIIGKGSIGTKFSHWLEAEYNDCQIISISARKLVSDDEFLTLKSSKQHQLTTDLIADSTFSVRQFDLGVIAGPASYRLHACNLADRLCKYLLIEKPIVSSVMSLPTLLQVLEKKIHKNEVGVGYVLRAQPCVLALKQWINEGHLGHLRFGTISTGQYLPAWRPDVDYRKTVSAKKELGGGVARELSHELDLAQYLFGELTLIDRHLDKLSDLDIDTEDFVNYRFRSKTAAIVLVTVDFIQRSTSMELKIVGTNGTVFGDLVSEIFKFVDESGDEVILPLPRTKEWGSNYTAQVRSLMGNKPLCSVLEASKLVPFFDTRDAI